MLEDICLGLLFDQVSQNYLVAFQLHLHIDTVVQHTGCFHQSVRDGS